MSDAPKLVIYGNGTIARMMSCYLGRHYDIAAFTVDRACIREDSFAGYPLCDFADVETQFPPDEHVMIVAVGFVGMNTLRTQRAETARQKGYRLVNFIHPSVDCSFITIAGDNNIILEHASLHPGVTLGSSNFVSSNTNIGHGCRIGDGCWFNAGVAIGGETLVKDHCVFSINAGSNNNIVVESETFVGPGVFLGRSSGPGDVFLAEQPVKYRFSSHTFLRLMNVG